MNKPLNSPREKRARKALFRLETASPGILFHIRAPIACPDKTKTSATQGPDNAPIATVWPSQAIPRPQRRPHP